MQLSDAAAEASPGLFPWSSSKIREYTLAHTRQVLNKGRRLPRLGVWLLTRLVRALPWSVAYALGGLIGWVMRLFKVRRSVAMTNLDIVYGNTKSAAEKDRIYHKSLLNFGRQVVNYLRIPLMNDKFWQENFTLENEQVLRQAYNQGKGVIFLYMHFGPGELPGGKISHSGYPIAMVAKAMRNPVLDKFVVDARSDMNLGTIRHRNAMSRIKQGLVNGEGIILVIDQNIKRIQGVFVDWMGRIASTVKSAAFIARETGAPVITGYAVQTGPKQFKMVMTEQIPWETNPDPDEELLVNTRNYVQAVEKHIYEMPEEWFWLARRWKVQPEGMSNPYK